MLKLSVITSVYNQERLVIKAIDSVPKRKDTEIIVIDDGSTDHTVRNVEEYMRNRPELNITLLLNEKNMGVGYTVNRGYDAASGEYVTLLDSDDYLIQNFERDIYHELDGTDIVYYDLRINSGAVWRLTPASKNTLVGNAKCIRRAFLGDTRCPEIRFIEDYQFYLDLLKKNPTEKFTNKCVKHYNHPRVGSLIWQYNENKKK